MLVLVLSSIAFRLVEELFFSLVFPTLLFRGEFEAELRLVSSFSTGITLLSDSIAVKLVSGIGSSLSFEFKFEIEGICIWLDVYETFFSVFVALFAKSEKLSVLADALEFVC
jgi:hypothetical protein